MFRTKDSNGRYFQCYNNNKCYKQCLFCNIMNKFTCNLKMKTRKHDFNILVEQPNTASVARRKCLYSAAEGTFYVVHRIQ